jgi:hypothetical protein
LGTHDACQCAQNPEVGFFVASPQKHKCGRHQNKWNRDEVREAVKALPFHHERRTIRGSLGAALGIPKSTLFDMTNDKSDTVNAYNNGAKAHHAY